MTRNSQISRPAETDPYVGSWLEDIVGTSALHTCETLLRHNLETFRAVLNRETVALFTEYILASKLVDISAMRWLSVSEFHL